VQRDLVADRIRARLIAAGWSDAIERLEKNGITVTGFGDTALQYRNDAKSTLLRLEYHSTGAEGPELHFHITDDTDRGHDFVFRPRGHPDDAISAIVAVQGDLTRETIDPLFSRILDVCPDSYVLAQGTLVPLEGEANADADLVELSRCSGKPGSLSDEEKEALFDAEYETRFPARPPLTSHEEKAIVERIAACERQLIATIRKLPTFIRQDAPTEGAIDGRTLGRIIRQIKSSTAESHQLDDADLELLRKCLAEILEIDKLMWGLKADLVEASPCEIVSIAKEYAPAKFGNALLELIQEGNFGLMKALDSFPYQNAKERFTEYAARGVREAIRAWVSRTK
jgi:hypothetical protein